jgi:transcriptional regulator with XRE-family HTH domain
MSSHPLKQYREKQRPPLTQAQLARRYGVQRESLSRWETGTRKIDEALVPMISEDTGIPASKLRPDLAALMRSR